MRRKSMYTHQKDRLGDKKPLVRQEKVIKPKGLRFVTTKKEEQLEQAKKNNTTSRGINKRNLDGQSINWDAFSEHGKLNCNPAGKPTRSIIKVKRYSRWSKN